MAVVLALVAEELALGVAEEAWVVVDVYGRSICG